MSATNKEQIEHRSPAIHEGTGIQEIRFFKADGRHGFLSNYFRWTMVLDGRNWETVEHYYQASKFDHLPRLWERLRLLPGPDAAKGFARERESLWRPDWLEVREEVMWRALCAKFGQSGLLLRELLATDQARLVEASPFDDFWGLGPEGNGRNRLGEMLMSLRSELREPYLIVPSAQDQAETA